MKPGDLSAELRLDDDERLRRRRKVAALSLAGAGAMLPIAAFQLGLIRRLPEPPLPGLDAEKVDASAEAYSMLRTPDAFLGLVSYGVTATLAASGGKRRPRWLALALGAKATADAAVSAKLTLDQFTKHRAFCSWCLAASAASFAALPYALRDAREALRG